MDEPERLPPPPFWRTRYFEYDVLRRQDRQAVAPDSIERTLTSPYRVERQSDGRWRYWLFVEPAGKWLRVVTLPDGLTVHNAFYDRSFVP